MKTLHLIVLAATLAVAPACKKKDDNKAKPGSAMTGSGSAMAGSGSDMGSSMAGSGSDMGSDSGSAMAGSGSQAATPEDPNADYIKIYGSHVKPKPTDPVELRFEKFKVVKADFDPKKIEGGKASIEVDAASIKSDSDKRDEHIKSPDYMDTAKFTNFTIDIDKVKKKDDKNFTAEATVKWRDMSSKYPVTFEVLEATDDSIKVKGAHKFKRKDWKLGGDPDKSVGDEFEIKVQLTLKKT